jgi:hypothetical protein
MDEYDKWTNKEVEVSKIDELAFPSLEPPMQPTSKMRSIIQLQPSPIQTKRGGEKKKKKKRK